MRKRVAQRYAFQQAAVAGNQCRLVFGDPGQRDEKPQSRMKNIKWESGRRERACRIGVKQANQGVDNVVPTALRKAANRVGRAPTLVGFMAA